MEHLGHLKSDDTFNFKSSFAMLPACRIDYSCWDVRLFLAVTVLFVLLPILVLREIP